MKQEEIAQLTGKSIRTIKTLMRGMQEKGTIVSTWEKDETGLFFFFPKTCVKKKSSL